MKIALKRTVQPPEAIQTVIDDILLVPLEETGKALKDFCWTFDRDDLHHWVALLDRIDEYLEKVLEGRKDVNLEYEEGSSSRSEICFPEEDVRSVLRVSNLLIENCINKHLYASTDRLYGLLAVPISSVVIAALETLEILLRRFPASSHKWPYSAGIAARTISLLQGHDHELKVVDFAKGNAAANMMKSYVFPLAKAAVDEPSGKFLINTPDAPENTFVEIDLQNLPTEEVAAMRHILAQNKLAKYYRFALLARVRSLQASLEGTKSSLQAMARARLLALFVAFQIVNINQMPNLNDLLRESTVDLIPQLTAILSSENGEIPDELQVLAIRVMSSLISSRYTRHFTSNVALEALTSGGPTSLLALLLHRISRSITVREGSTACEDNSMEPSKVSGESLSGDFIGAVMALLTTIAAQSSGLMAVSDTGLASSLIPLIQDKDPQHLSAVGAAVRNLETFLEYTPAMVTMFREMNGHDHILQRLNEELDAALAKGVTDTENKYPLQYSRRLLIKSLLRTLCSATFDTNTGASRCPEGERGLFSALATVLKHPKVFGAGLFAVASMLVSNVIHIDPLLYKSMEEADIQEIYIDTIKDFIPVSPDAVSSVLPTVSAFCLNTGGLKLIKKSKILHCLVSIFTSKAYVKTLQGEGAGIIGQQLEELVRHSSELRPHAVTLVLNILYRLCVLGGSKSPPGPEPVSEYDDVSEDQKIDENEVMDVDDAQIVELANQERETNNMEVEREAKASNSGNNKNGTSSHFSPHMKGDADDDPETYLVECATYTARMLENFVQHKETAKLFIERNGIELLLEIYQLPALPETFGSTNASHALLDAFRVITGNSEPSMMPQVFRSLRKIMLLSLDDAIKVVSQESPDTCIPELENHRREKYMRALSTAEALTALAALLVRNSASLLPDVAIGGEKSLILRVGDLERYVLKHVARADEWHLASEAKKYAKKERKGSNLQSTIDSDVAMTEVDHATSANSPRTEDVLQDIDDKTGTSDSLKQKKCAKEIAFDVLLHYLHTARMFYQAVAKAVHVPSRRGWNNEERIPTAAMKASALALALVMKRNLIEEAPNIELKKELSEDDMRDAYSGTLGRHARYMTRSLDQVFNILFDSRRRTTHCLAFNFFIHCEGLHAFLEQFKAALKILKSLPEVKDTKSASLVRAHLHRSRREREKEGERLGDEKAASMTPITDPALAIRISIENLVNSFLVLMTNMSYVTMIAQSPSCGPYLTAKAEGISYPSGHKDPAWTIRQVWQCLLGAVLPLWRDPITLGLHPRLIQSVVSVMRNCTEHTSVSSTLAGLTRSAKLSAPLTRRRGGTDRDIDSSSVRQIQDMGFSSVQAQHALRQTGNYVELAIAWLAENPEFNPDMEQEEEKHTNTRFVSKEDEILNQMVEILHLDYNFAKIPASELKEDAVKLGSSRLLDCLPGNMPRETLPDAARAIRECLDVMATAPASAFFMSDLLRTLGNRGHEQRDEMSKVLIMALSRIAPGETASKWFAENLSDKIGRTYANLIHICMEEGNDFIKTNPGSLSYWSAFGAKFDPEFASNFYDGVPEKEQLCLDEIRDKALQGSYGNGMEIKKNFMEDLGQIQENVSRYNKLESSSKLFAEIEDLASGMLSYFERLVRKDESIKRLLTQWEKFKSGKMDVPLISAEETFAVTYLTAVVVSDSGSLRECLATHGLTHSVLTILNHWHSTQIESLNVNSTPEDGKLVSSDKFLVPRWIDCLLLVLGQMSNVQPKFNSTEKTPRDGLGLQQVQQALQQVDVTATDAERPSTVNQDRNEAALTQSNQNLQDQMTLEQPALHPQTNSSRYTLQGNAATNTEPGNHLHKDPLGSALRTITGQWNLGGILSEKEQGEAASIGLSVIQKICSLDKDWHPPPRLSEEDSMLPEIISKPDPRSSAQAALQLLSKLSKIRDVADTLFMGGAHRLVLSLPDQVYGPRLEPYIAIILRHILEDESTLQSAMEAEIKSLLASRTNSLHSFSRRLEMPLSGSYAPSMPIRTFFASLAPVAARNPKVFLQAVNSLCELSQSTTLAGSQRPSIRLKVEGNLNPRERKPKSALDVETKVDGKANVDSPLTVTKTPTEQTKTKEQPQTSQPRSLNKHGTRKIPIYMVEVIDALLEVLLRYKGHRHYDEDMKVENIHSDSLVNSQQENRADGHPSRDTNRYNNDSGEIQGDVSLTSEQVETIRQVFVLRLLGDLTLKYQQCIGVLLKRDSDSRTRKNALNMVNNESVLPTSSNLHWSSKNSASKGLCKGSLSLEREIGGLFQQVINCHLALSPAKPVPGVSQPLSSSACYFLLSVCIRSSEGRKRVAHEIVDILEESDREEKHWPASKSLVGIQLAETPFIANSECPRPYAVAAAIVLTASLLSGAASRRLQPGAASPSNIVFEIVKSMKEAGIVSALTAVLGKIDFSHRLSAKTTATVLRSLEILTKTHKPTRPRDSSLIRDRTESNQGNNEVCNEQHEVNQQGEERRETDNRMNIAHFNDSPVHHTETGQLERQIGTDRLNMTTIQRIQGGQHARASPTDTDAGPQAFAAAQHVISAYDRQERHHQNLESRMIDNMIEVSFDEENSSDESSNDSEEMSVSDIDRDHDEGIEHPVPIGIGRILEDEYGEGDSDSDSEHEEMTGSEVSNSEDDSSDIDSDLASNSSNDETGDHNIRGDSMEIVGPDGLPIMVMVGSSDSGDDSSSGSGLSTGQNINEQDNDDSNAEDSEGDEYEDVGDDMLVAEEMLMAQRSSDEDNNEDDLDEEEQEYEFVDIDDDGFDVEEEDEAFDSDEEYEEEDGMRVDSLLDDTTLDDQAFEEGENLRQPTNIYAVNASQSREHSYRYPYFRRTAQRSPPRHSSGRQETEHPLLVRPTGMGRSDGRNAGQAERNTLVGEYLGPWHREFEGSDSMFRSFLSRRNRSMSDASWSQILGLEQPPVFGSFPNGSQTAPSWLDADGAVANSYGPLSQMLERAVREGMTGTEGVPQNGNMQNFVQRQSTDNQNEGDRQQCIISGEEEQGIETGQEDHLANPAERGDENNNNDIIDFSLESRGRNTVETATDLNLISGSNMERNSNLRNVLIRSNDSIDEVVPRDETSSPPFSRPRQRRRMEGNDQTTAHTQYDDTGEGAQTLPPQTLRNDLETVSVEVEASQNAQEGSIEQTQPEGHGTENVATAGEENQERLNETQNDLEGIDPEFLAALPPDLQAEVIEQHRQEQRLRALSARNARGRHVSDERMTENARQVSSSQGAGNETEVGPEGPSGGEFAALLESFPEEIRDEAMISATDEQIATLPLPMRERAERIRERFSSRMEPAFDLPAPPNLGRGHDRTNLLGSGILELMRNAVNRNSNEASRIEISYPFPDMDIEGNISNFSQFARLFMPSRSRARDGSRRHNLIPFSNRRRDLGTSEEQRLASKESPEAPPQMSSESILGLLRLFALPQQAVGSHLSIKHLNRLFSNLAASEETRKFLLQALLSLLRVPLSKEEMDTGACDSAVHEMDIDMQQTGKKEATAKGTCIANELGLISFSQLQESLESLGLVNRSVMSKENGDVLPPSVTKRVLSTLEYLCRNQSKVSSTLIDLEVPTLAEIARPAILVADARDKGKASITKGKTELNTVSSLQLLLTLPCRQGCKKNENYRRQSLELVLAIMENFEVRERELLDYEKLKAIERKKEKASLEESKMNADERETIEKTETVQDQVTPEDARTLADDGPSRTDHERAQRRSEELSDAPQNSSRPDSNNRNTNSANREAGTEQHSNGAKFQQERKDHEQESWYEEMKKHRPVFAKIPLCVGKALTRLLTDSDFTSSDADSLKIILQGLIIIIPEFWVPVLEELKIAAKSLAAASLEGIKELYDSDIYNAVGLRAGILKPGRLLDRCFSCLWDNIAQIILDSLEDSSPWLSERAQSARSLAAPIVEAIMLDLDNDFWPMLQKLTSKIEKDLKSRGVHYGVMSDRSQAPDSKILPPAVVQIQPLIESMFLLAEAHRALHAPLSVLAAEAKSKLDSIEIEAAGEGASIPGASGALLSPSMDRSNSLLLQNNYSQQHIGSSGSTITPGSPTKRGTGTSPIKNLCPSLVKGEPTFLKFSEKHRILLNLLVHNDPELLDGPFALLLRVPRLLDFENKRIHFRSSLKAESRGQYRPLSISVRRDHVFEDSFNQLRMQNPEAFRGKLSVSFSGEEGVDAGGLTREWFQVMSREIFNPAISLFEAVPPDSSTFQPNPNSVIQSDPARGTHHLDFFKFVGRVVGKALRDGQHIDAHFTRSFYKHMLALPLTYEDIEAVDPDFYKNLRWMLENDIEDVLDLVFAEEVDFFGRKSMVELCSGGSSIKVTNENKREYVDLIARHRMTTAIRSQIDAFLRGFWDVVPRQRLNIFNDHELELLISGLPDIDIGDLRANTEYNGYTTKSSVVHWFWEVANDLEQEDKALLIQFVTGTSKVPLDGFKALQGVSGPQKFSIHKVHGNADRLPTAHTCFNQLDLPEYESKEILKERLLMAIREGSEGFGFV